MKKTIATALAALLGIGAALALGCFVEVIKVQGTTMEPTLAQGSCVMVWKWAYLWQKPKRGDLVAFPCDVYSEDGEGSTLIRRVAAIEGDSVEIKDGALYVNGRRNDQNATRPVHMEPMKATAVKKGRIFVLSDNRTAILDSRDQAVGQPSVTELTGKVQN